MTKEALEGSIKKWEAIVDGTGNDHGTNNCPLCAVYINDEDACAGCPVYRHTKKTFCDRSPYEKWASLKNKTRYVMPWKAITDEEKAAAQEELDFLKSLLSKYDEEL